MACHGGYRAGANTEPGRGLTGFLALDSVLLGDAGVPGTTLEKQRLRGDSMTPTKPSGGQDASTSITKKIQELGDWRGDTLARLRKLIHDADPDIQEEWKWQKPSNPGVPVWSHDGGICTGESYKEVVKLTFFRGASVKDPKKLFNSSLEGSTRRAIDFREGETIDEAAFKQLIRAAVAANAAVVAQRPVKKK
jgi:hypothetical protein